MNRRSNTAVSAAAFAFLCAAVAFAVAIVLWSMQAKGDNLQVLEWGGTVIIGGCSYPAELVLRRNGLAACAVIIGEPK